MGTYAVAIFVFLYAPLVVLMVFAFNAGDQVTVWTHFGFRWFAVVFANEQIQNAARDSLVIACVATIVSTVLAVCAAMALERGIRFKGRSSATALVAMPLVVPEIVAAVSTLIFFSSI
ncbi:MAG: spermidine/putrescine ABC transporter permease PotC, partial [Devosia sp.]